MRIVDLSVPIASSPPEVPEALRTDIEYRDHTAGASDIEAMLNYYKANYPREPYVNQPGPLVKVQAPVLMFHGLKDPYLLPGALNDTWNWVEKDLTLITIPTAGHFVHRDAADFVTRNMVRWLTQEPAH